MGKPTPSPQDRPSIQWRACFTMSTICYRLLDVTCINRMNVQCYNSHVARARRRIGSDIGVVVGLRPAIQTRFAPSSLSQAILQPNNK